MTTMQMLMVCMEVWAVVISLGFIIVAGRQVYESERGFRRVWLMLVGANILLISDAVTIVFQEVDNFGERVLLHAAIFLVAFLHFFLNWEYVTNVNKMIHGKDTITWDKNIIVSAVCLGTCVVLLLTNRFTHVFYFFNENGVYEKSNSALVFYLLPIVSLCVCALYVMKHHHRFSKRLARTFTVSLILVLISIIVQYQMEGFAILDLAIGMDILLLFCEYWIDRYENKMKKRMIEIDEAKQMKEGNTDL